MNKLVAAFIERKSISIDMDLNPPLENCILLLEQSNELVYQLVNENIEKISSRPYWGPMFDMYEKNYEYCSGAVSLFLLAQLTPSEALCRTSIEGSINLEFVSIGDSMGNQISYFKHYIDAERKQNKNWKESVRNSDQSNEDKEYHYQKIAAKDAALLQYENALRESLKLADVDFDNSNLKWPNIFERFRSLNKEVEYRTLYMALCSQAHNDAEDVLNKIMARVTANIDGMEKAQEVEQYLYSLFYILSTVRYHIYSSAMFIAKFEIDVKSLLVLYDKVMEELTDIAENLEDMVRQHLTVNGL
jgi:hypothetical protein